MSKRITRSLPALTIPVLTVAILRDEKKFAAKCLELDLVTEMDTPEQALEAVVEQIMEYAEDYLSQLKRFRSSPNRAHHYPYLRAVRNCKDEWQVRELLEVRYGSVYVP